MLSSAASEVLNKINILHKLSSLLQFHRRGFSQAIFSKTSHQKSKDSLRHLHVGSRLSKKAVYKDQSVGLSKPLEFTQSAGGRLSVMEELRAKSLIFQEEPCQYRRYTDPLSFFVLIGYMYFRERNNIDAILDAGLDDNLPELEMQSLESAFPNMKAAGMPTLELEARIKFLKKQRKQVAVKAQKGQEEEEERLRNSIVMMKQEGADTTAASEKLNELTKKRAKA